MGVKEAFFDKEKHKVEKEMNEVKDNVRVDR